LNTNKDKKWPGMKIWNFANFFTEDVNKKSYFSTIFWLYSRLHLIANRLIAKFVLLQKKLKHRSIYHSFNVKTRG
ncbi:hypothetical protein BROOK1789B_1910, partial [Bathymodiolus brooksi thiotrophic gill symbiont]